MATEKLPNDFFRNFLFLKFSLFWRNDARKTNFSGTAGVLGLPGVLGFRVLGGIHCKQIEDVQSGIVPPKNAQVGGDGIEHLHLGLLGMRLLDCEEQERAIAKWGFWGSGNVFFIIMAASSISMCKIKQQYQHLLIMNVDLKS